MSQSVFIDFVAKARSVPPPIRFFQPHTFQQIGQAGRAALVRALRVPPALIRASVVERFGTCGKPTCHSHSGAKHGPYYYLTQCLAPGRIRKFLLKSDPAIRTARRATQAFSEFYDQLEELSQINTELLQRGEPLEPEEPAA